MLCVVMLNVFMLMVAFFSYAECHNTEHRYAECLLKILMLKVIVPRFVLLRVTFLYSEYGYAEFRGIVYVYNKESGSFITIVSLGIQTNIPNSYD